MSTENLITGGKHGEAHSKSEYLDTLDKILDCTGWRCEDWCYSKAQHSSYLRVVLPQHFLSCTFWVSVELSDEIDEPGWAGSAAVSPVNQHSSLRTQHSQICRDIRSNYFCINSIENQPMYQFDNEDIAYTSIKLLHKKISNQNKSPIVCQYGYKLSISMILINNSQMMERVCPACANLKSLTAYIDFLENPLCRMR